ncbi:ABC transporter permease [Roseivirga misakiensis]|uniref:ABC-2 type transporter transmembrane domain-containing protein n=1 Tax=Roseivirga misakiensis TaxID=1563681 RepID=A0A1E5SY24_9BACT|nr:DUF3526 domain-containing protein [Roseivirga misakiensis]OEK04015.1 hypothetical protein BFP71_10995 [Roseivirga misakiensis]
MVFHIAKKEIRETARSGQFKWMLAIVVLLCTVAVFISQRNWEAKNIERKQATENARTLWLAQGATNPHNAAHYGTFAFKPQFPLSLIDPGVEKYTGVSIFLEAHSRNEADMVAAADQTGLSRFGDLTPDFILLFVIPLLIIVMGHRSVTREKEGGMLRIIKSQGVSNWQLVFGKWIGNFMPIAVLTAILFIISALFIENVEWPFLITMLLVYLAYFAIMNSLTLFISTISRSSGLAMVSLLTIWIVGCLAVPKIASSYTNDIYPYPTRVEFEASVAEDKSKGLDGHDPWNEASKKLEEETLKEYNVEKLEDLPFNFDALRMQKGEEHEAAVYFKHNERLKEIYESQTKVYRKLAVLSPFLPTRFMSMALANTDYATHWNFSDKAEKHRVEMQRILNTNFAENSKLGEWDYQADASLLNEVPDFAYEAPDFKQVLVAGQSNLLILSLWLVLSFGLLFYSSTRL